MEPTPQQVVLYTTVLQADTYNIDSSFVVELLNDRFWISGACPFAPGDRVKITITKEPEPDALPR